jgi:hypothetical protein
MRLEGTRLRGARRRRDLFPLQRLNPSLFLAADRYLIPPRMPLLRTPRLPVQTGV